MGERERRQRERIEAERLEEERIEAKLCLDQLETERLGDLEEEEEDLEDLEEDVVERAAVAVSWAEGRCEREAEELARVSAVAAREESSRGPPKNAAAPWLDVDQIKERSERARKLWASDGSARGDFAADRCDDDDRDAPRASCVSSSVSTDGSDVRFYVRFSRAG